MNENRTMMLSITKFFPNTENTTSKLAGEATDYHKVSSTFRWTSVTIATLGIFGNLFVIFVMLRNPRKRAKTPNILVINQSLLDLTASLFIVIDKLILNGDLTYIISSNLFKEIYCRLWKSQVIKWAAITGSTFNLCLISFERYLAIVWPMRHIHFTKSECWIT